MKLIKVNIEGYISENEKNVVEFEDAEFRIGHAFNEESYDENKKLTGSVVKSVDHETLWIYKMVKSPEDPTKFVPQNIAVFAPGRFAYVTTEA